MARMSFQCTVSGPGYGFVYVMSYPGSDKVKIGHALDPTERALRMGATLAPETPVLEAYYWCSERREEVERRAHELEKESRHKGEWFKTSVESAMLVIERAAEAVNVQLQLVFDNGRKPDFKNMTKDERSEWLAQQRRTKANRP